MKHPVFLLLLALIAANIEMDLFLPSFPQMKEYFQVDEAAIEAIISINFLGLAISGLFSGWISDIVGRKKVLSYGMALFTISSIGCTVASSFPLFLFFRLLQGIGCGAPATISFAAVCDLYSGAKATKVIYIFNGVITGVAIGAPLLGVILESHWGWRSNFILIAILATLSLLLLSLFFRETLLQKEIIDTDKLISNFKRTLLSESFWVCGMIAILVYSSIMAFLANFSLICIDHLQLSVEVYGWLQASLMISFATGSFISAFALKDVERSTRLGLLFLVCGCLLFASCAYLTPAIILILISMALFNFGAAFLIGIFSTLTIQSQGEAKGLVSSVMGSLRIGCSALYIYISGHFFSGTFGPLAIQFLITGAVLTLLVWRSLSLPKPAEPDPAL